jgi:hypothetical protein
LGLGLWAALLLLLSAAFLLFSLSENKNNKTKPVSSAWPW